MSGVLFLSLVTFSLLIPGEAFSAEPRRLCTDIASESLCASTKQREAPSNPDDVARAFHTARASILAWITRSQLTDESKHQLLLRVNSVRLDTRPGKGDEISLFRLENGVLHVGFGDLYLARTPPDAHLFALAHELAHALDDCQPYWKMHASCWNSKRDDGCGPGSRNSERFADWVAAQVLVSGVSTPALASIEKALGPICRNPESSTPSQSTHPSRADRLKLIINTLGRAMGCPHSTPTTCQW